MQTRVSGLPQHVFSLVFDSQFSAEACGNDMQELCLSRIMSDAVNLGKYTSFFFNGTAGSQSWWRTKEKVKVKVK